MQNIDRDAISAYISARERELFRHNMSLSIDERETFSLRGAFREIQRLKKALEQNFANPEGRNAN